MRYHMHMDNETRIAAQVARGMTRQQACALLGIAYTKPETIKDVATFEAMLDKAEPKAIAALIDIAENGSSESARVAAANALLDRKRGKPSQAMTIDSKTTVTHNYIMQLAPDEAYRQLMQIDVIDMGGGDTVDQAAGVIDCETPPQDTRTLEDYLS